MAGKIKHFKRFSVVQGDIKVNVNLSRFEKQYRDAQFWLDSQVMTDMVPYMPHQTGTFVNITRAMSAALAGSGEVVAAAPPYGRFLYEGKKMVDIQTGKGPRKIPTGPGEYVWRYRKGAKLKATEEDLTYSNPKATPHWFDTAKDQNLKAWVKGVKKRAGGG